MRGAYSSLEKARKAGTALLKRKFDYWKKINARPKLNLSKPEWFDEVEKVVDPISNEASIGWRIGFRWKEADAVSELKVRIDETMLDIEIKW